jgi:signal transduction histidine kinase/CheY-like chemotaxis protein
VRAAAAAVTLLALALTALALLWLARQRTQVALERAQQEREAALAQLEQAQRMEALGRLAGGVAHDFNNVLQVVLGGAKLISRRTTDPGAVQRLAGMIVEAAERGASVTRRLLAFARRDALRAEPLSVNRLLTGLEEVLAHMLGANTVVRVEAAPDLPMILVDRGQLETVLVNLAINGRDAMALFGHGVLTLSAVPETVLPGTPGPAGLAPGRYLRLAVADTGTGMDAATLARAVEPFFTTKPKGQGTGLGLAMAKGFAEQSDGAFRIKSEPGQGTTVWLWLPCAPSEATPAPGPASVPTPPAAPEVRGHILLVDDEPQVRAVLAAGLRERGHQVAEAEDGRAALALLDQDRRYDLLVTDLARPGLDGLALLHAARRQRPGLPALLVTGYVGDAQTQRFTAAAAEAPLLLLRKPVSPDELAGCVTDLLQGVRADLLASRTRR